MNISKQTEKQMTQEPSAKRDVTIRSEPKYLPDHVMAETDTATWEIPLDKDERYDLAEAYEQKAMSEDEERAMLSNFTNSIYANTAVTISVTIKPSDPGEVLMEAESQYADKSAACVPYSEVGQTVCKWVEKYQHRKDLVADLVADIAQAEASTRGKEEA